MPSLTRHGSRKQELLGIISGLINAKSLVRIVLGKKRPGNTELQKVVLVPVEIRQGYRLKAVLKYPVRDITRILTGDEAISFLTESLEVSFFNADIFSIEETLQFSVLPSGKEKLSVRKQEVKVAADLRHDRIKSRQIETQGNIYLRELGVLDASFAIRRDMNDKFVQINRYIELLSPHLEEMKIDRPLRVVDMGSGKGYLTFALYDFLMKSGQEAEVTGIELRQSLVERANEIARLAGFAGLSFVSGEIATLPAGNPDILIALHACDTATDDAILQGIKANAAMIVVAPCCHKQVRKSFKTPPEWQPVLKHGILLERHAEILTDAIRSMVLEAFGYKTMVFEFVSSEHTPKNLMIVGRRVQVARNGQSGAMDEVFRMMKHAGVTRHHLVDQLISEAGRLGSV